MGPYPGTDSDDTFDYLFKIVLIGDAGVGKTCVVQRFKSGTYVEKHGSTIGVDFTMKTLQIDGKLIKVPTSSSAKCVSSKTITSYDMHNFIYKWEKEGGEMYTRTYFHFAENIVLNLLYIVAADL